MGSNQLSTMLQELEVKVDTADPQQALLLGQARAHTKALQLARGDWERRSNVRSWNADALPEKDTPPMELPSYRDYAAFITKDDARPCEQKLSAPDSRCELLHGEKTAQALEAAKPTGSAPQGVRV